MTELCSGNTVVRTAIWRTVTEMDAVSISASARLYARTVTRAMPLAFAMSFDTAMLPLAGWLSPLSAVTVTTAESAAA